MPEVYVTHNGARVCVPFREDLATLIPHARALELGGARMLVFPNQPEEARLARNLGLAVPAPILTRYDWRRQTPWDVQRATAAMLSESKRAYVLSTMGTGKTRSAIYAYDYLRSIGVVKTMLVAAPLSTLTPVWESELFGNFPNLRVKVLYGSREKRLKLLASKADVYVVNHHGLVMLRKQLADHGFDVFLIDELTTFKNKGTELWKAADAIMTGRPYGWGMTGSPTPSAPTDAWAQIRLVTPENTTRTLSQFQDMTMRKVTEFKWVKRPDANKLVHSQMQPSVRFTRDNIAELPETTYADIKIALDPLSSKAYKLLFDKMRMQTQGGKSITAVNEGVLQMKLLQVACGYIYTDDRTIYELPNTNRLAALDAEIAGTYRKVIVFAPFIHALAGIAKHLRDQGLDVAVVSGEVSRGKRDVIFQGFQHGTSPRIIVAHPQCMAHGLTLTAANTVVWYAPAPSLEIYEQANARIVRPGQTSKTRIAHIFGTAIEKVRYAVLRERGKSQGLLLDLFQQQTLEY